MHYYRYFKWLCVQEVYLLFTRKQLLKCNQYNLNNDCHAICNFFLLTLSFKWLPCQLCPLSGSSPSPSVVRCMMGQVSARSVCSAKIVHTGLLSMTTVVFFKKKDKKRKKNRVEHYYATWVSLPLCFLMKSMILCSPSPGTLASERKTCKPKESSLVRTHDCQDLFHLIP